MNINLNKEGPKGLITEPSEIDRYIKVKILGEAIQLVKNHKKAEICELDSYLGYQRLLPSQEFAEYSTFTQAKRVFDALAGQSGQNLTISKFGKMAKVPGMTSDTFMKPHFDITFKHIISQKNASTMDLDIFFDALEYLGEQLFMAQTDKIEKVVALLM